MVAMFTAVEENQPMEVFQRILEEAISIPIEDLYILTVRCMREDHLSGVIQLFLEHKPAIARHVDQLGNTVLHRAFMLHDPVHPDTIRLILDENPNAIHVANSIGLRPLHAAVYYNASVETFDLVLSRDPSAAAVSALEWEGLLPLHMALLSGADERIILSLLDVYPEAVLIKTEHNQVPLTLLAA